MRHRLLPFVLAARLSSPAAGRTFVMALVLFLIVLCLGSAGACPYFQTPDVNGNCVCALEPPGVARSCISQAMTVRAAA